VEYLGEGLDRQRLRQARYTLEEEVAAGEKRDEHPLEHCVLADDHPPDLVEDGFGRLPSVDGFVDPVTDRFGVWAGHTALAGRSVSLRLTGRVGHEGLRGPWARAMRLWPPTSGRRTDWLSGAEPRGGQ